MKAVVLVAESRSLGGWVGAGPWVLNAISELGMPVESLTLLNNVLLNA
jgi:hypothetical protein